MNTQLRPPANSRTILLLALILGGCASPREGAMFVTKTSYSVVEADTTPASLSVGYDRQEGYAGPRFKDGGVYPVASSIQTTGRGLNQGIRQVFVGGQAALLATESEAGNGAGAPSPQMPQAKDLQQALGKPTPNTSIEERKVLFLGTSTNLGLKLSFADGTLVPTGFNFGYRRKEAAYVPLDDEHRRTSVLGSLSNGVEPPAEAASQPNGVTFTVTQYLATGEAADHLAAQPQIRAHFINTAREAMEPVQTYRLAEAAQGRMALDAISCSVRLSDVAMPLLLAHGKQVKLFEKRIEPDALDELIASTQPDVQRARYTVLLSSIEPGSEAKSEALKRHQGFVCGLLDAGQFLR